MKIAVTSEHISSRWQRGNSQRARGMTVVVENHQRLLKDFRDVTPKTIDFRALPEYISSRWQRGNPKTCENQMAFYAAALLSKECCRVSVRKSKTFQGALKKHIKTVHENCVSSSSKTSRLSTYRLKRNRNMFERLRLTEVESKIILLYLYNILVFE